MDRQDSALNGLIRPKQSVLDCLRRMVGNFHKSVVSACGLARLPMRRAAFFTPARAVLVLLRTLGRGRAGGRVRVCSA